MDLQTRRAAGCSHAGRALRRTLEREFGCGLSSKKGLLLAEMLAFAQQAGSGEDGGAGRSDADALSEQGHPTAGTRSSADIIAAQRTSAPHEGQQTGSLQQGAHQAPAPHPAADIGECYTAL